MYWMQSTETHSLFYYLIYWTVSALAVFITAKVIPGFKVRGFWAAFIAAVVIALVNTVIWPILILLTLPINILTLGLLTFVINGAIIKMAAAILEDFEVKSWWSAIFGALALSIINAFLHLVLV